MSGTGASHAPGFTAQAAALIGTQYVSTGAAIEPRYLQPARYGAGQALAVVKPATTEEVSALAALAQACGIDLITQGAHTGLVLGATPCDAARHVVLSTDRLRQRFELDPLDRVLRVSAGFRLSEINERLHDAGLSFPIDLSADPSMGGMLAANTGGTRMLRYGDVRANTLGLTVVLGEPAGEVLQLEPAWMKNNAGLDFKHLFIGSNGALGVVTEAVIKLHPLPAQRVAALVAPASQEAVWPLYAAAGARLGDTVSAFEGISRRALQLAVAHGAAGPLPFGSDAPDYAVLLELSSPLAASELDLPQVLENFLQAQMEAGLVADAVVGRDEALWRIRHGIGEGLRAHGHVLGLDLSFARAQYWPFVASARTWLAQHLPQVEIADFGHLGDGGVHFNLVWPHGCAFNPRAFDEARAAMYRLAVEEHGGCFSAEHGVGPHVQALYDRYTPPSQAALAQRLVDVLAPRGGFSRARYGMAA
ncbi:FAD-binding oxidoreductase [Polaromonas jejuensis]|uniref:FAD-binding oxidoreductase n=1 Tax=Polaromonas jejuensis TaxID=457502 RepID=A0ABW0QCW5_9BURK|nr:FAD-binding oxidoreductase [Polaromonas jejuensis]